MAAAIANNPESLRMNGVFMLSPSHPVVAQQVSSVTEKFPLTSKNAACKQSAISRQHLTTDDYVGIPLDP
jgi:hypothetical protein